MPTTLPTLLTPPTRVDLGGPGLGQVARETPAAQDIGRFNETLADALQRDAARRGARPTDHEPVSNDIDRDDVRQPDQTDDSAQSTAHDSEDTSDQASSEDVDAQSSHGHGTDSGADQRDPNETDAHQSPSAAGANQQREPVARAPVDSFHARDTNAVSQSASTPSGHAADSDAPQPSNSQPSGQHLRDGAQQTGGVRLQHAVTGETIVDDQSPARTQATSIAAGDVHAAAQVRRADRSNGARANSDRQLESGVTRANPAVTENRNGRVATATGTTDTNSARSSDHTNAAIAPAHNETFDVEQLREHRTSDARGELRSEQSPASERAAQVQSTIDGVRPAASANGSSAAAPGGVTAVESAAPPSAVLNAQSSPSIGPTTREAPVDIAFGSLTGDDAADRANTDRIVRGLNTMINQRGGVMHLRLQPAELGQLRVQMQVSGSAIEATFDAQSTSAQSMLQKNMAALRSALEGHGLHVERLSVTGPAQSAGSQQGGASTGQQSGDGGTGQSRDETAGQQDAAGGQSRGRNDDHGQQWAARTNAFVASMLGDQGYALYADEPSAEQSLEPARESVS